MRVVMAGVFFADPAGDSPSVPVLRSGACGDSGTPTAGAHR